MTKRKTDNALKKKFFFKREEKKEAGIRLKRWQDYTTELLELHRLNCAVFQWSIVVSEVRIKLCLKQLIKLTWETEMTKCRH